MSLRINAARLSVLGLFFGPTLLSASTIRVEMVKGHEFSPSYVEIQPGDTVEFVNTTSVKHTVTADPSLAEDPANVMLPEGAETFDSGKLDRDQVFAHTFSVPGLYQYVCLPHEGHMRGQIKVLPAPAGSED